jgi:hypothetical protein
MFLPVLKAPPGIFVSDGFEWRALGVVEGVQDSAPGAYGGRTLAATIAAAIATL